MRNTAIEFTARGVVGAAENTLQSIDVDWWPGCTIPPR